MIRMLILWLCLLGACASPQGIVIESRTEPLILEGDYGPPCAVRVELSGHVYMFASWVGCGVVRREVHVPEYHDEGVYKP